MPFFLLILSLTSVAATTIAWYYGKKTKEEEKKQIKLTEEIEGIKAQINNLQAKYNISRVELFKTKAKEIADLHLRTVREYRKEKEAIGKDIDRLLEEMNKFLLRPDTSPYLARGIKKELVFVEEAKQRLDAYFRYLAWYEGNLEVLRKKGRFEEIINMNSPEILLPEDWLYVGKLALLDGKHELNQKNKYGQILKLSGVYKYHSKKMDFEPEEQALMKYESDIPVLIVHENKKVFENIDDFKYDYISATVFRGSVLKGELYINHIIPNIPIPVKPEGEVLGRQENFYLYKDAILCKMKRKDKKFPLKIYPSNEEIYVYPLQHDLLLKRLFVSERESERDEYLTYPVFVIFPSVEELNKAISLTDPSEDFYVTEFEPYKRMIKLKSGNLHMKCEICKECLKLREMADKSIDESVSIYLPFRIVLATEKQFEENRGFILDDGYTLNKLIDFVDSEFNYLKHSKEKIFKDYDFTSKWLSLLEIQIKKEEFNFDYVYYSAVDNLSDNKSKNLVFTIDRSQNSFQKLLDIDKKLRENFEKIKNQQGEVKICLEMRTSPKEKFSPIPIGILKDDIDLIRGRVTVELDDQIPEEYELSPDKRLYIGIYQPVSHLTRQKRALTNFQSNELVNSDLKRMLIEPNLIRKSVDPDEELAFDRSIKWKNPNLTENQKEVIKKALLEKNIFLIQGPPGTGKTTVIKEIVFQFLKDSIKKKCLIVSQQNVAVDNALSRIYLENYEEWFKSKQKSIVRVASLEGKIDPLIKELTIDKWFNEYVKEIKQKLSSNHEDNLTNKYSLYWYNLINKDDISKIDREIADVLLSSHQIVGATCVGFSNKRIGIERAIFDLVIIDEAARATPPELLIPILRAKKVIMIGDQYQLPPSISKAIIDDIETYEINSEIRQFLEKSFFENLYEDAPDTNKAMLIEQFRMPEEIGNLVSQLFYNSKLKNGVKKSKKEFVDEKVIKWIDVRGSHEVEGTSKFNRKEAKAIGELLLQLQRKISPEVKKTVAVITPYTSQKNLIRKIIHKLKENGQIPSFEIKCDTVDSFQGQEADIVIYSVVRTGGNLNFVLDRRRLNVAISRTRENLFFIGNREYLYSAKVDEKTNYFKDIIDYIDRI